MEELTLAIAQARVAAQSRRIKDLEKMLELSIFWLEGAVTCKSWNWDPEQKDSAMDVIEEAEKLLSEDI